MLQAQRVELLGRGFGAPSSPNVFALQNNLVATGALSCSGGQCDGVVGPKTTLALLQILDHIPGVPPAVASAISQADQALQSSFSVDLATALSLASSLGADSILQPLYNLISDNASLLTIGVGIYLRQIGKVPPAPGSTNVPPAPVQPTKIVAVSLPAVQKIVATQAAAAAAAAKPPFYKKPLFWIAVSSAAALGGIGWLAFGGKKV